jgi:site-specific recombinase XerD
MTVTESVARFRKTLISKARRTRQAYGRGLDLFEEFLSGKLTQGSLEEFYLHLLTTHGASTANVYIVPAQSWLQWLVAHQVLPKGIDPFGALAALDAVRVQPNYKAPRQRGDVREIVRAADDRRLPVIRTNKHRAKNEARTLLLRDRAILWTLYSSGLRKGELTRLNRADLVDQDLIVDGKGGKERLAFIDDETETAISAYLDVRSDHRKSLFLNVLGGRLGLRAVDDVVKKFSEAAGEKASPHDFRHAYARRLINAGASLSEVQDLLGHASPNTTKIIYARYDRATLRQAYDAAS